MPEPQLSDEDMLDEYDFTQAVRRNTHSNLERSRVRIETENGETEVQIQTVEVKAIVDREGRVTIQLPPEIATNKF